MGGASPGFQPLRPAASTIVAPDARAARVAGLGLPWGVGGAAGLARGGAACQAGEPRARGLRRDQPPFWDDGAGRGEGDLDAARADPDQRPSFTSLRNNVPQLAAAQRHNSTEARMPSGIQMVCRALLALHLW